ncbi:MAG: translation initiation factor IF-3 [Kiritimatiellae bacterium]|nr:translation initiation factor IF-3 [Kiritimatiellia bacterium]
MGPRPSNPNNQRDIRGRRPGEEFTRTNQQIRVPAVRCLLPDGTQLGVVPTREALWKAQQMGLDLVEISPNAQPPVCKIMDYGKWKYEEDRRKKEARKNQARTQLKEVKFHANTDVGDYQLKMRNIRAFLADGNKVKLTLMFRGRENAHKELGEEVLQRVCADLADVANVEQEPKVVGRSCTGLLAPKSQKGK